MLKDITLMCTSMAVLFINVYVLKYDIATYSYPCRYLVLQCLLYINVSGVSYSLLYIFNIVSDMTDTN